MKKPYSGQNHEEEDPSSSLLIPVCFLFGQTVHERVDKENPLE
jgi:hypothetical protein